MLALTLIFRRMRWGAPPEGWRGTAGSGVTVCTGRGGFRANFFKLAIRLSHIKETSSILCNTWKMENFHKKSHKKKRKNKKKKSIKQSTKTATGNWWNFTQMPEGGVGEWWEGGTHWSKVKPCEKWRKIQEMFRKLEKFIGKVNLKEKIYRKLWDININNILNKKKYFL